MWIFEKCLNYSVWKQVYFHFRNYFVYCFKSIFQIFEDAEKALIVGLLGIHSVQMDK